MSSQTKVKAWPTVEPAAHNAEETRRVVKLETIQKFAHMEGPQYTMLARVMGGQPDPSKFQRSADSIASISQQREEICMFNFFFIFF